MDPLTRVVTDQQIAQLRRLVVFWLDAEDKGSPWIGGYLDDRENLVRFEPGMPAGDATLHGALRALEVLISDLELAPGRYQYQNVLPEAELALQPFVQQAGVERSGATVTVTISATHTRLLRSMNFVAQEEDGVVFVGVDPKRPYGEMSYFYLDMARLLGMAPQGAPRVDRPELREFTSAQLAELEALHALMQPALQVLIQQAPFSAGRFARSRPHGRWQRVAP